ncbi:hypothetical protein DFJ74DRAFT_641783 [Hyaloraphidium curvatum]|nr:hypothetical protein DFJ74DRAFT_641783 [Hyaloraphidium curvatum]
MDNPRLSTFRAVWRAFAEVGAPNLIELDMTRSSLMSKTVFFDGSHDLPSSLRRVYVSMQTDYDEIDAAASAAVLKMIEDLPQLEEVDLGLDYCPSVDLTDFPRIASKLRFACLDMPSVRQLAAIPGAHVQELYVVTEETPLAFPDDLPVIASLRGLTSLTVMFLETPQVASVLRHLPNLKTLSLPNVRFGLARAQKAEARAAVEASSVEHIEIAFFRLSGDSPKTHEMRFWRSIPRVHWVDYDRDMPIPWASTGCPTRWRLADPNV